MGSLQHFCLYTFIGLYWYPSSIPNGLINMLFSIFMVAMILAGLFLISQKIIWIRRIKKRGCSIDKKKTEENKQTISQRDLNLRRVSLKNENPISNKSVFNIPKKRKLSIRPSIFEDENSRIKKPVNARDSEDDLFVIVEEDIKNIETIYNDIVTSFKKSV
jgi:hypothetical protein